MKFVAKSIALLAGLVLVTAGPSYAQPLRSTSIPSSLADDEKRLMPKVMSEFYSSFDREKSCWISTKSGPQPGTRSIHVGRRRREYRQCRHHLLHEAN